MELTTVSLRSFRIPSNPSFLSSAFAPTRLVLVRSTSPYLKISSQLGKIKPLSKKLKVSEKTVTNEVEKEILPEDVLVIETKQPNSSVSSCTRIVLILLFCLLVGSNVVLICTLMIFYTQIVSNFY